MKPRFSREFYEEYWERFLEPVSGEHYINLEGELSKEMAVYTGLGLSESDMAIIRTMEAQKIADKCRQMVLEDRDVAKAIENGTASFGMTTERQEIEVQGRFIKRFEFNCLQMSVFKEKYGLQ